MKKEDLLLKVFRKCYYISTHSKCDVFFDYSPHCNFYSVYYYKEGWGVSKNPFYLHRINGDVNDTITIDNLTRTYQELNKLWELIEENNLKKN